MGKDLENTISLPDGVHPIQRMFWFMLVCLGHITWGLLLVTSGHIQGTICGVEDNTWDQANLSLEPVELYLGPLNWSYCSLELKSLGP